MNYNKASFRLRWGLTWAILVGLLLPLGLARPVVAQEADRRAHVVVTVAEVGLNIVRPFTFEAALYAGPEPGQETEGRLTQWVADIGGTVNLRLPQHALPGATLPWGEEGEVYVRLRTTNVTPLNPYPAFDMVGEAFTLEDRLYTVAFTMTHRETTVPAERAAVELVLEMQGESFDLVGPWELSLYARHADGSPDECYTEFKPSIDGVATTYLPEDVEEGEQMRWNAIHYAHMRTVAGLYPYIELAGSHFILRENEMTSVYMGITHSVTEQELPDEAEPIGSSDYVVYTVVQGDTLSAIALRAYGTSRRYPEIVAATNELARNDSSLATITNPNLIRVGWRIVIPDPLTTP